MSALMEATSQIEMEDCAASLSLSPLTEIEDPNGFVGLGAPVYGDTARLVEDSPILQMSNADTPTLLIAGEMDHFQQSAEQAYMLLARKGVPVRMLNYWGEGHNISSPGNQADILQNQIAWFDEFLQAD